MMLLAHPNWTFLAIGRCFFSLLNFIIYHSISAEFTGMCHFWDQTVLLFACAHTMAYLSPNPFKSSDLTTISNKLFIDQTWHFKWKKSTHKRETKRRNAHRISTWTSYLIWSSCISLCFLYSHKESHTWQQKFKFSDENLIFPHQKNALWTCAVANTF